MSFLYFCVENGQALVRAHQDIKECDVVLKEKMMFGLPTLISMVTSKGVTYVSRCANWNCWKPVTSKDHLLCKNCNCLIYCGQECMDKMKFIHEKICSSVIKKKNNKKSKKKNQHLQQNPLFCNHLGMATLFLCLNMNPGYLKLYPQYKPTESELKEKLTPFIDALKNKFPQKDKDELEAIATTLHYIAFPIRTFFGDYNYGTAFFKDASYINHSCDPNCYYYISGNEIVIKALKPIKKGEEITIAYEQEVIYASHAVREMSITNLLGCKCNCYRCNDENVIKKENIFFETTLKPPSPEITNAVYSIAGSIIGKYNVNNVDALIEQYDKYFLKSHSLAYQLFKKHSVSLFEHYEFKKANDLIDRLFVSCHMWDLCLNVSSVRLRAWATIFRYVINMMRVVLEGEKIEETEKRKKYGTMLEEAKDAVNKVFDWKAFEMDAAIYPMLKQILLELPFVGTA